MKKVLLIAALAVSSVSFAQISFGVQLGGNIANQKYTESGVSITPSSKFGLTLGGVAELPITKEISFRPELNFVQKGSSFSFGGETVKTTLSYLEIPLNFTYNLEAGSGNLFLGAGPSIGFGIGGKISAGGLSQSVKFDGNKNASDELEHFKSIDFGFGLLAGYKLSNNFLFSLGYNMGLSDIDVYDASTTKNKGFAIKVGYMFGGVKK